MKLMLKLTAALQAVAAYLSSTLPSLLALLKKMAAILRGNDPVKAVERQETDDKRAATADEQQKNDE